jgi:hypothetical protein
MTTQRKGKGMTIQPSARVTASLGFNFLKDARRWYLKSVCDLSEHGDGDVFFTPLNVADVSAMDVRPPSQLILAQFGFGTQLSNGSPKI